MVSPHPLRLVTCQHGTALALLPPALARELGMVREEGELGAICGAGACRVSPFPTGTLGLAPAATRIP